MQTRWLALASLCLAISSAGAQQCGSPEAVTSFGEWISPAIRLTSANWAQRMPVDPRPDGVGSMRLLLEVSSGNDRKWNVVVRDDAYRVLATLGAGDFLDDNDRLTRKRWTGRMPVKRPPTGLRLDLVFEDSTDVQVSVASALVYPPGSSDQRFFSVQDPGGAASWQDLYSDPSAVHKRAGDTVGMMVAARWDPDTGSKTSWCCSGVLLSKNILLTNWHCGGDQGTAIKSHWNADVCANTLIDLAWDDGDVRRQYSCAGVELSVRELDFALIRLAPILGSGSTAGEPVVARLSPNNADKDVFVLHHALCKAKLSSANCTRDPMPIPGWVDKARKTEFTHTCDTEPGASGAPVFDSRGRVVGLHHVGFARDANCNLTDRVNKAISIAEIIKHVQTEKAALAAELGFR